MDILRHTIERLERDRQRWADQVGIPESGMKESDIRFLDGQIQKLLTLESKIEKTLVEVTNAIQRHTREW